MTRNVHVVIGFLFLRGYPVSSRAPGHAAGRATGIAGISKFVIGRYLACGIRLTENDDALARAHPFWFDTRSGYRKYECLSRAERAAVQACRTKSAHIAAKMRLQRQKTVERQACRAQTCAHKMPRFTNGRQCAACKS